MPGPPARAPCNLKLSQLPFLAARSTWDPDGFSPLAHQRLMHNVRNNIYVPHSGRPTRPVMDDAPALLEIDV